MTLEQELTKVIKMCGRFLYDSTMQKPGQAIVLMLLLTHENISVNKIAYILNLKASSISEILKKLEDEALIEKVRSKDDARKVRIKLTQKGYHLALLQDKHDQDLSQMLYQSLSDKDKDYLTQILKSLYSYWQEIKDKDEFKKCIKEEFDG